MQCMGLVFAACIFLQFLKNANLEVLGSSAACYIQMEWLIFSNTRGNYLWLLPLEIQHNYDNRACIYFNHLAQRETIFLLYEKENKKLNRQPKEYAAPEEQSNVWATIETYISASVFLSF